MKTINETFTDDEFAALIAAKGDLTWHDFILKCGGKFDKARE